MEPLPASAPSSPSNSGSGEGSDYVRILGAPRLGCELVAAGDVFALSGLLRDAQLSPEFQLLCQFQWHRAELSNLYSSTIDESWTAIPNATRPHYVPSAEDVGKALAVTISVANTDLPSLDT